MNDIKAPQSQPIEALAALDPMLDESAVRAAIAKAEANNQDPLTATMDDYAQGQGPQAQAPVAVPQKFLKPDGVVDVEKIQASTQALDTAIQQKEEAITKTVDDYMREYNERETKFRTMPNPQKMQASLPAPVAQPPAMPLPEAEIPNYEDIVRRDYAADPLGTTTRLLDLMIKQKFQPLEEKEKAEATRQNLSALAAKDPRILREDVYAQVTAKLNSDPHLWTLKNPHRTAWLEVKEEMRLGDPVPGQAQPSRLSPVLGGGTPPSTPSTQGSVPNGPVNLDSLDLRDKAQEAAGDEAIRRMMLNQR